MSKYLPIAERLRQERERMGHNQADFAAIGGATRKTQYNYESGERVPDAGYLAEIAAAGADVNYILTGIPCIPVTTEAENAQPLPSRAKALLDNYLNTDDTGKRIIEATALAAAQSQPTVKKKRR